MKLNKNTGIRNKYDFFKFKHWFSRNLIIGISPIGGKDLKAGINLRAKCLTDSGKKLEVVVFMENNKKEVLISVREILKD